MPSTSRETPDHFFPRGGSNLLVDQHSGLAGFVEAGRLRLEDIDHRPGIGNRKGQSRDFRVAVTIMPRATT